MKKLRSFTLPECLLALVILALLADCIFGMTRASSFLENRTKDVDEKNWYLFLEQTDEEFRFSNDFKVLNNGQDLQYTYTDMQGKTRKFGLKYSANFQSIYRFDVDSGGFMPSLENVSSYQFTKDGCDLSLVVHFIEGKSYQAHWYLNE